MHKSRNENFPLHPVTRPAMPHLRDTVAGAKCVMLLLVQTRLPTWKAANAVMKSPGWPQTYSLLSTVASAGMSSQSLGRGYAI
jgi:hypothetical protein